jgi:hypothetical protein
VRSGFSFPDFFAIVPTMRVVVGKGGCCGIVEGYEIRG